ncbi:uncharacterized protein PGTG_14900 [Puccinia graminis f. sp. tritici CRL 75-36-700-3]|uniref:Uncharacterized protein n=1 Tax=Puccinia graminis f. sp. tritici (strain CRL 75-36-700-3 / race SCCL) TaxID=418459 RepID=E3KXX3_PUCGT|nr:uncharacterized protein PGTG_14900 [Puccinia graminis f. sp. tritici CRL 75-36-700-3]EFP89059.2 hypothetical protein PGTG_14900 [Puccinia graminis f. sp. tritici CRL 75-36-700-3]
MIPKCKAYSPQHLGAGSGLQCDPDPDPIPWDRITLSDPIPYFSIPGIEKSIRSDKLADTVSDRICFTVIQMIDCSTSYRLFSPRDLSKPQGSWSLVSSKRKFTILFPAVSTNLKQFREIVATASDKQFRGAGDLIRNALCGPDSRRLIGRSQ